MADLALSHGPWKKIVSATWGQFPVQIYQNPDKVLLVTLFEKKGDEIEGVLVLERRALVIEGDATKFSLTQKREMTFIEKITRENRFKYLIVDSTPAFVPYSETDLSNEVAKQYEELDALVKLTKKGIEGSTDVKTKELKNASEEEIQNLIGDPIAILQVSKRGVMIRDSHDSHQASQSKFLLGVDREETKVEANVKSVFSSIIIGENSELRLHLTHILAEGALLNSIPCVIFDSSGAFSGLALPNKDKEQFEKFGMKALPIGFPFKQFDLGKSLFVDLSMVDPALFLSSFNLEKADVAPLIQKVYGEKGSKISVLSDLIVELSSFKETKEFPKFSILRAIRIIEVMQKSNPLLFGKNISEELTSPWKDGLGKVLYINLAKQGDEVKRLIVNSILKTVTSNPFSSNSVLFVFEPNTEILKDDVLKQLVDFPKQGKGFIIHGGHEVDLQLFSDPSLKMEIVGTDVVVAEKGETKKRFIPRPAFSLCEEYSNTGK
ncbi:hypothetical protein HY989_01840 [Candidatus Micrarchaeota archaeon]|nr:hypothetical protein [Candidatus Micrarchaeota archaeon]